MSVTGILPSTTFKLSFLGKIKFCVVWSSLFKNSLECAFLRSCGCPLLSFIVIALFQAALYRIKEFPWNSTSAKQFLRVRPYSAVNSRINFFYKNVFIHIVNVIKHRVSLSNVFTAIFVCHRAFSALSSLQFPLMTRIITWC